jgi:hypothetical protein
MVCDICRKETNFLEHLDYCSVCFDCFSEMEEENSENLFKDIEQKN